MALAPVVIVVGTSLLRAISARLGFQALGQAFKSGSLKGIASALVAIIKKATISWFTISAITNYFWSVISYLWNFNWNVSDEEIHQSINASINALASVWGGALGTTLGSASCSLGMIYLNPSALMYVDEITEEMADEIADAIGTALRSTLGVAAKTLFLLGYKSVRSFLKDSGIAAKVLGETRAKNWGKSKNIASFSSMWENFVENINPEWLKNFIENFAEEFFDACKEITLIVANYADMALGAQRRTARQAVLGDKKTIEIYPNRDVETEKYVLYGREELIKPGIVNLMTTYQFMGNRDVGVIVNGEPYIEKVAQRAPKSISLMIDFTTSPSRPFYKPIDDNGIGRIIRPSYEVANIERGKLDWERIKLACGGKNGYMYGPKYVTYKLISKSGENRGSQQVYAETISEADNIAKGFIALTDSEIASASEGGDLFEGNRTKARGNAKPTVRVYPYRMTIVVGLDTILPRGRRKLTSATARSTVRFSVLPLWPDQKPHLFDDELTKLFTLLN